MFLQRLHSSSLISALQEIGVEEQGIKIMQKKSNDFVFRIFDLPLSALHILKQEALSVGADLGTPKEAILCKHPHYDAILLGSLSQLQRIAQKCLIQPFGLKALAHTLSSHLKYAKIPNNPKLMAILNLTPDSFYTQSRFKPTGALEQIKHYINLGVEIIDIGPASSRPGSDLIEAEEEIARIQVLLEGIESQKLHEHVRFSIDTYNPKTADFALNYGFELINDISGFSNPMMLEICKKHRCGAILMHSKGTPKTMQSLTHYDNLFAEIDSFFSQKLTDLHTCGIQEVILDIGFGFAKTQEQNLALIQHLEHFKHFGLPLLVGASRKNTIGLLTGREIQDRLSGTLAIHHLALQRGAEILRIHDIKEHLDLLKIFKALEQ